MKKQIILCLLTSLFWMLCLSFSLPGNPEKSLDASFVGTEASGCPAPAPTNLSVTGTTPNSVSLAWIGPASSGVYYKVKIYDQVDGIYLPSVYTIQENATIDSLTEGHCYTFWISASYCSGGDYGDDSDPADACCGIIITDIVMEFTDPSGDPISATATQNSVTTVCMPRSTSADTMENPVIIKILYNNLPYRFGMGLEPEITNNIYENVKYIGVEMPFSNYFRTDTLNSGKTFILRYGTTDLLTVDYIETQDNIVTIAYLDITVLTSNLQELSIWDFCNNGHDLKGWGDKSIRILLQKEMESNTDPSRFAITPSPNPFRLNCRLNYALETASTVEMALFDAFGRRIKTVMPAIEQPAGMHEVMVPGESLATGIYFLHTRIDGEVQVHRLVKQE